MASNERYHLCFKAVVYPGIGIGLPRFSSPSTTMSATFATLFERSRYSGRRWWGLDEDDSAREQGMKQQERFAVSMIGLALEHDPKFLAHLLERVCGLKGLSGAHGWEVFVEPQNWGDLVLKHRASSSFVVVEFKIEANLEEHQNPSTKRFFLPTRTGECAGYGREIAQIASRENWRQLRYVTVEKRASWSKVSREDHNLECVRSGGAPRRLVRIRVRCSVWPTTFYLVFLLRHEHRTNKARCSRAHKKSVTGSSNQREAVSR